MFVLDGDPCVCVWADCLFQPMKSYTFSKIIATAESLLAFLDKDLPSVSEVDYTSSRAKYRRIVLETTTVAGQTVRNDITRRMMDLPVPLQQIIEAWLDVLASEVETPSEDSSERPLRTTFSTSKEYGGVCSSCHSYKCCSCCWE